MKNVRNILLFITLIIAVAVSGQSRKELERQRKNTLKQLETTTQMLKETKQNEKATSNKLRIINQSIKERQKLIDNIGLEINAIDTEVDSLTSVRDQLSTELVRIKNDYATMIRRTHIEQMNANWLTFLLSADDFSQAIRRLRYLNEFSKYRQQQGERILGITAQIEQQSQQLLADRQQKEEIKVLNERERATLDSDKQKQAKMLSQLKAKEKDLRAQQRKHQKKADELNRKIEKLIAEEIRKAEEAKKKKQGGSTKPADKPGEDSGKESTMTKEEKLVAGNFEANKGRMPWPVEKGFVSGSFGVQPHPQLEHVTINNKGIYLQTTNGSAARAVFQGEVTQCFAIPGSNNAVIVKHGNYRTVYANLTSIFVKVGDKVSAKQKIGTIYSDPENDNKTELYFQLWKDKTVINPQPWLSK